ncbi:MAG: DUF6580 family putative transport protein [Bryobacteraceae bacterium]
MSTKSSHTALGLVIAGALLRLMPHPPNVAPVGAMSLFSGARLAGWQAYAVPLLLMALTDPILGAIQGFRPFGARTFFVYGSFLISVWIGRRLRDNSSAARIGAAAFACALQFYLITNLYPWYRAYPHTAAGLLACYIAALPFFGRTLAGNFLYAGLFFGVHAWLTRHNKQAVAQ